MMGTQSIRDDFDSDRIGARFQCHECFDGLVDGIVQQVGFFRLSTEKWSSTSLSFALLLFRPYFPLIKGLVFALGY